MQTVRAVDIDSHPNIPTSQSKSCRLPEGFPIVVTEDMQIVQPILLFLWHVFKIKRNALGTIKTYCQAIAAFFQYVVDATNHQDWRLVDGSDLVTYRDCLAAAVSPKDKRPYKNSTIINYMVPLVEFYVFAHDRGWTENKIIVRANSNDKKSDLSVNSDDVIPHKYKSHRIHAFTSDDLNRLMPQLGQAQTSRDRLVATSMLVTGMRIREALGLSVQHAFLLERLIRSSKDDETHLVRITRGVKGGQRKSGRDILVPTWLAKRWIQYVETERSMSVTLAKKANAAFDEFDHLFVNGPHSPAAYIGMPLQVRRYQQIFEGAQLRANLTSMEPVFDEFTGQQEGEKIVAAHVSHDLRHTIALIMYFSLAEEHGESAAWCLLQTFLGHAHVTTTMNKYGDSIREMKLTTSDAIVKMFQRLSDV